MEISGSTAVAAVKHLRSFGRLFEGALGAKDHFVESRLSGLQSHSKSFGGAQARQRFSALSRLQRQVAIAGCGCV